LSTGAPLSDEELAKLSEQGLEEADEPRQPPRPSGDDT
jgi:hypothetical protein